MRTETFPCLYDLSTFAEVTVMNLNRRGKGYIIIQKSSFISGPGERKFESEHLPGERYCAFSCQFTETCFSFEYLTYPHNNMAGGICNQFKRG